MRFVVVLFLVMAGCVQKGVVASGSFGWGSEDLNLVRHSGGSGYEFGAVGMNPKLFPAFGFEKAGISYSSKSLKLERGNDTGRLTIYSIDPYFSFGFELDEHFYFAPGFRLSLPVKVDSELGGQNYSADGAYNAKFYVEGEFGYRLSSEVQLSSFLQLANDSTFLFGSKFYDGVRPYWSLGIRVTYLPF
jgi:hypothetical protein